MNLIPRIFLRTISANSASIVSACARLGSHSRVHMADVPDKNTEFFTKVNDLTYSHGAMAKDRVFQWQHAAEPNPV